MEKPSNTSQKASAEMTFEGISHMTYNSRPFSPCTRPFSRITSTTLRPSSGVRQNGTMSLMLVRPMSFLALSRALHSRSKAGR